MTPQDTPSHAADDEWSDRDYPVREDMAFQRRTWGFERAGWVAIVLLVLLALAGVFSIGPLSTATATDGTGSLTATYQRFQRNGAGTVMELTATPPASGDTLLHFDTAFLDAFSIEAMQPEPLSWQGNGQGMALAFNSLDRQPFTIRLALRPESVGPVRARIGFGTNTAGAAPPAQLRIFIYP